MSPATLAVGATPAVVAAVKEWLIRRLMRRLARWTIAQHRPIDDGHRRAYCELCRRPWPCADLLTIAGRYTGTWRR